MKMASIHGHLILTALLSFQGVGIEVLFLE
jgi:hypothetical protein